ncbi:Chitin synthase, class 3 [Coemansia asiatica]|nr:Chitin synthase, class 3 [Coemansia asiatica]
MGSNNYYNNGTFDSQNNNNNQQQQQYSQQYEQHAATNSDGFDGVLSGSNTQAGGSSAVGYFGLTEHNNSSSGVAGGVELELMSNTSSNTRNDAVRDRLDHRTASDISSSHGASNGPHNAEQPLISGEPLLQGIGEVPVGTPEKRTTGKDDTKHIHRRRKPKKGSYDEDDDDDDAQAGAYSSYQAPQRTRSLVRPERAVSGGGVAGTGQAGGKQSVLTRSGTASRARNSTSGGMRQRRKQQQVVAAAARRKRWCPHPWQTYCRVVTFWAPGRVLKCFGMAEPAVQMAWREKMGLVSIILAIMAVIAFLTFGLQQVLCGLSGKQTRIKWNEVGNGYAVVNGRAYDITKFKHAKATPWTGGAGANIMGEPANAGGKDLSFLFQNPNSACKGVLQYDSGMLDAKNNVPGARDKAKPTSSHARGGRSGAGGGGGAGAMPRHSAFFSDHRASQFIPDDAPAMEIPSQLVLPPPQNPPAVASPFNFELAYTLLLVTCYSEGSHGIRTTLDSLCGTDYPASHKCLFIICDGLIKGAGEEMYTPDVCLSMMTDFVIPPDRVQPYSYVSIAQGAKRHNMAKLYAGYYAPNELSPEHARNNRVPMILVVKCGTPEEASEAKPGNRGKRDSQIILMSFLQRVMFDERMTELEYELFNAMWNVTGVTPDNFEIVLMVDADTKVYVDSVTVMVKAMVDDPSIMGQCGETKIANKTDSWVTMIQVFEYYIAHHQAKAFESVFGGVTCLPGCFCMYRIKAPKGQHGYWVPILANPDIVENYSENVVDTLHKKNLLLLGEDRYLSTLMLRTFPKRKMMFIPSSVCKTIVPDEFKVLLSQRRRWINSTVHNLGELVLVNDLCGTFCLSMQFMIFMDLIGTLALPAAIAFTFYVVIISTFTRPVPWLPLALLGVILGLPAVLIGLTSRKLVYIGWMLIYLCSLPIWNFVLPTYAYWHFDDFSWGQTRMVQGEGKDKGHGEGNGEFDSSQIVMKRWCDFEAEKRRKTQVILGSVPSLAALAVSSSREAPSLGSRQSRVMVASRPVSIANSGSSHRVNESPRLQTSDSADQLISTVGQAAVLQMAASKIDDLDAHAAAGSIERLGYMTPNIIPVLASQGLQQSLARGSSGMLSGLATPTGAAYPPSSFYSIGNGPMSPESPSYANYSANYSDASSAGVPAVPAIPQQYAPSSSPRSQRSREDTSAPSSGEKSTL